LHQLLCTFCTHSLLKCHRLHQCASCCKIEILCPKQNKNSCSIFEFLFSSTYNFTMYNVHHVQYLLNNVPKISYGKKSKSSFQNKIQILVVITLISFNIAKCMHKWVDPFGCHVNQFCLAVVIVMLMLFYKFWNLLNWIWFNDHNLNIYMMHKIIKAMDFWTQNSWIIPLTIIIYVDYDMVHWFWWSVC
jgi:hypothetical protein